MTRPQFIAALNELGYVHEQLRPKAPEEVQALLMKANVEMAAAARRKKKRER